MEYGFKTTQSGVVATTYPLLDFNSKPASASALATQLTNGILLRHSLQSEDDANTHHDYIELTIKDKNVQNDHVIFTPPTSASISVPASTVPTLIGHDATAQNSASSS